jgi:hypothetical protein
MAEIHFRSMEASHNKSDATNRFGDRDFISAACTCFIRKCGRFEAIADVRSLKKAEIHFRSMEASNIERDVLSHDWPLFGPANRLNTSRAEQSIFR